MAMPKELKEFFDKYDVLIVDKNSSSRSRLMKTILDLGAKKHRIKTCGHIDEAREELKTLSFGMVISDYTIGGGFGFDLFREVRAMNPKAKDLCFVLVTANLSQSSVAKAAEEDVDNFIIKPYTVQNIQESLTKTIKLKINPTPYMRKIDEGKSFLKELKLEEAMSAFKEAMKLDPKPALALFYLGHLDYKSQQLSQAQSNFNKGLIHNNIHFKCLIGLYDLFIELEDFNQAYEIVRKLSKYFPTNPDRLKQGIHLSVKTKNYEDMPLYYDSFKQLETRPTDVINYIGAGLYIAGKQSLQESKQDEALKLFESIAVSCSEFTKFLRAIVQVLVEFNLPDIAEKYLSRFSPDSFESSDYLISDFLVSASLGEDAHKVLARAKILHDKKIQHNLCHQFLIQAIERAGVSKDRLKDLSLEEVIPQQAQLAI